MDIDKLAESKQRTHIIYVKEPSTPEAGDGTGFVVVGPNSDEYQASKREAAIRGVHDRENRAAPVDVKTRAGAEEMVDYVDTTNRAMLRHCVVDWIGFKRSGDLVPFSVKELDVVLTARPDWVSVLVDGIENRANFAEG
jgi:hypothetical protein